MAGRKPRVPRDVAAGNAPLRGIRVGRATVRRDQHDKLPPSALEVADLFEATLREVAPEHLKADLWQFSVRPWAEAEGLRAYLAAEVLKMTPEQMASPAQRGMVKTPVELYWAADREARRHRQDLGITPSSYARIVASLGLQERAVTDALARHAEKGEQIVANRRLRAIEGGKGG